MADGRHRVGPACDARPRSERAWSHCTSQQRGVGVAVASQPAKARASRVLARVGPVDRGSSLGRPDGELHPARRAQRWTALHRFSERRISFVLVLRNSLS